VDLHDGVGDVQRLVGIEQAAARLQDQGVALLAAVVVHHPIELLNDAGRELGVRPLEVTLQVLVLALEIQRPVLELALPVAPVVLLHGERLLLELVACLVEVLALLAEVVLRLLELAAHRVLGLLAGVTLVERALQIDHGDPHLRLRGAPEHDAGSDCGRQHAPRAARRHAMTHERTLHHQNWNGPPKENSRSCF
jgi:hypothetical protein